MARAYSEDLRERFCRALDRGLSAKPMGGHKPVVLAGERDWLLARLERECDPMLAALVAALREERGIEVCRDTLWRLLKRYGKSFKKNALRQGAGSARRSQ